MLLILCKFYLLLVKISRINPINFMQFYRVLLTIVSETVKMSKINWINRLIVSRLILAFNRAVVWGTPSPHLMTYSANSQSWAMHVWWRPCLSSTAETQTQEHLDQ